MFFKDEAKQREIGKKQLNSKIRTPVNTKETDIAIT